MPPLNEVTSLADTKDKTETTCDGDACTHRTGATCRNGTTNGQAPPPSVSLVPLLCVLSPALSCSLCAVLSSPQQRTMSSVLFYPTADEYPASLKTWRGFADGFWGRAQVQRDRSELCKGYTPRGSNCVHPPTW